MIRHRKIFSVLPVLGIILLMMGCSSLPGHSVEKSPVVKNLPAQDVAAADVVATIEDRTITLPQFMEEFDAFSRGYSRVPNNMMEREKFLNRLVQMVLFSIEAKSQDIDKDKLIEFRIRNAIDRILAGEYFRREILNKAKTTDDEIKDYYETHLQEFKTPGKVKAGHILIKVDPKAKPEEWAKAETRAGELKEQLNKGADFAALAKENSDDPATRETGGKLGYFTRGKISQEFSEAAFSLKPGGISDPVKSPKGYHIIEVEARMPEQVMMFDKVKGRIKSKLTSKRQRAISEQIIKGLKEKHKVVINTEVLNYNDEEHRPSPSSLR